MSVPYWFVVPQRKSQITENPFHIQLSKLLDLRMTTQQSQGVIQWRINNQKLQNCSRATDKNYHLLLQMFYHRSSTHHDQVSLPRVWIHRSDTAFYIMSLPSVPQHIQDKIQIQNGEYIDFAAIPQTLFSDASTLMWDISLPLGLFICSTVFLMQLTGYYNTIILAVLPGWFLYCWACQQQWQHNSNAFPL